MTGKQLTITLNTLYQDSKNTSNKEDMYKLKFKEFCTITIQIRPNGFLFLGGGCLIEETQKNLELLTNSVRIFNSIFKAQFQFKENVLGFRFSREDQVILTLYIEKIDISFGDIDRYLNLLKEFINSPHKYELSDLEKNLTLSDMSLTEVSLTDIYIEDSRFINILQLKRTTQSNEWFCIHSSEDVYRFKNFDFTYALLFKFLKESINYAKIQGGVCKIIPDILEVLYLSPEDFSSEFFEEFTNSLYTSQTLVKENFISTKV